MFLKTTILQIKFMLKSKEAIITFSALLMLVICNFVGNVLEFQGMDVSAMYHPMKLLTLSYNKSIYDASAVIVFTQLFPLLAAFPAGFSYVKEHQTREDVYLVSRMGKSLYYTGKLVSAFLCSAIVFSVPFLIEIGLNCISFPQQASGDFTNMSIYNAEYISSVRCYLFSDLYVSSPILYAVVMTVLMGIVSGMLGMFTVAFSYVFTVKYRVLLVLPVYLLLSLLGYADSFLPEGAARINWFHYLLLFDYSEKSEVYMLYFAIVIVVFVLLSILRRRKGDLY